MYVEAMANMAPSGEKDKLTIEVGNLKKTI
jgi:hypothetical protein